jgi:hypothetical protein
VEKVISSSVGSARPQQHELDHQLLPSIMFVALACVLTGSAQPQYRTARIVPTYYLHGSGPPGRGTAVGVGDAQKHRLARPS